MKPFVIACLLSVLGLLSLGFAPRGEGQGAGNQRIGVVDLNRVQAECRRLNTLMQPLQAENKKWRDRIKAILKERKEKERSLENFEKGTVEFNNLIIKMKVLEYRASELDKLARLQAGKVRARCLLQFYKEIEESVRTIAKTRGLSVVFQYNPNPAEGSKYSEVSRISIRQREPLLYVDDKVDISGAVIKLLNSMK